MLRKTKLRHACATAFCCALSVARFVSAQATEESSVVAEELPEVAEEFVEELSEQELEEMQPREFTPQRADSILRTSIVHEDRWWLQAHLSGGVFDTRRDILIGRWNAGAHVGRRFSHFGVFAMIEFDQTFEFTVATERLDVFNAGLGFEALTFLGHVRSSIAAGASVLLSDTAIDEAGRVGWFIDFRPATLRWPLSQDFVFELTPLSLDIIVPVTDGIPLVVLSNMTIVGIEWALP